MLKRLFVAIMAVGTAISVMAVNGITIEASSAHVNRSVMIKTSGNKIVYAAGANQGQEIRLTGMNVPSLEWGNGENIIESLIVALDMWNSNIIRLPVKASSWSSNPTHGTTGFTYRETVDRAVKAVEARGKYIIIDLHEYRAATPEHKAFWESVAPIYANNPAVLYGLLNEPHDTTWEVWRNGGEYTQSGETKQGVGIQALVETVRDAGAKNILVAGGLSYAYESRGIVGKASGDTKRYALEDKGSTAGKTGNGIVYDVHIYTWKKDWNNVIGPVREEFPILVGEFGWDDIEDNHKQYGDKDPNWMNKLFDWMDVQDDKWSQTHFTGWCFHPTSSPRIIKNWRYEPTNFLGTYVYNKLLSLNPTAGSTIDTTFSKDFTKGNFSRYSYTTTGNAAITSAIESDSLKITYTKANPGDKAALSFNRNPLWYLNDLNQIKFTINGPQGTQLRVGLLEADSEVWSKDIALNSGTNQYTINVSDLRKEENYKGDGKYTAAFASIYIEVLSTNAAQQQLTVSQIEFACLASGNVTKPADTPYVPNVPNVTIDTDDITKESNYVGKTGDVFNIAKVENDGYKGTTGLKLEFKRIEGSPWSGNAVANFPSSLNLLDGKYFSFVAKGDGLSAYSVKFELVCEGGTSKVYMTPTLSFSNDEWYQFTYNLEDDLRIWDATEIKKIKFHSAPALSEGTVIFDDFTISAVVPELLDFEHKEYENNFSPDVYTDWVNGIGQKLDDTIIPTDVAGGKKFSIAKTGLWSGYAYANFPFGWDFSNITYMKVVAKGDAGQNNGLTIILRNGHAPVIRRDITVTGQERTFILPLHTEGTDLSAVSGIFLMTTQPQQHGDIIISEISFLNYHPGG